MPEVTARRLIQQLADELACAFEHSADPEDEDRRFDLLREARAYLAQPEPAGPTDEDLLDLAVELDDVPVHSPFAFAREVLKRWGTARPRPIPVAERLPTEADCDNDGQCWWYSPAKGECKTDSWEFAASAVVGDTHWLPAAAIPLPEVDK
jgi:hypothetical protein